MLRHSLKINLLLIIGLLFAVESKAQTLPQEQMQLVDSLYEAQAYEEALPLLRDLSNILSTTDTLYPYALWYYSSTLQRLEFKHRMAREWEQSLSLALERESIFDKTDSLFMPDYQSGKYWNYKAIIVAYFGLNQAEKAMPYRDKLYAAYQAGSLPEGIDHFYNFEFFVSKGLNIWGYEWFEELPEDRFSSSFSKIVYYVYSQNPDGSDKDQLYRLHVLMFHNLDPSIKIDYVLTQRWEEGENRYSSSLYDYTYTEPVDFSKLRSDIRAVIAEQSPSRSDTLSGAGQD